MEVDEVTPNIIQVPSVQEFMIYGIDYDSRSIYLNNELEGGADGGYQGVIKGLQYLDRYGEGPIKLWINTPGGDIHDMFAIYDAIRMINSDVITIGIGSVCSAGTLLLVAGDKRYCTENCYFMTHQGRYSLDGSYNELTILSKMADKFESKWSELMAKHTKKNMKWWKRLNRDKTEVWYDALQMRGLGIVDHVLTSINDLDAPK